MERSLLLNQLDTSWKNHLYTMDHLRSGIGLVGYAQEDPKIVYKQEGMKEFERDVGGRGGQGDRHGLPHGGDGGVPGIAVDDRRDRPRGGPARAAGADGSRPSTNAAASDKKPEPIRNRGEKVGRNDPCPCGSGKKYKNCHMRPGGRLSKGRDGRWAMRAMPMATCSREKCSSISPGRTCRASALRPPRGRGDARHLSEQIPDSHARASPSPFTPWRRSSSANWPRRASRCPTCTRPTSSPPRNRRT